MKKKLPFVTVAMVFILISFFALLPKGVIYAEIVEGTYEIEYEMKEAGNDNTSIADGYFSKPATLTVEDGVQHIQITLTSSRMIQSLRVPSGEVEIVSEDEAAETRTVKFPVDGNLSEPVVMEMHIIVPDLYDMTHTARAIFNVSKLDTVIADEDRSEKAIEDKESDERDLKNTEESSSENESITDTGVEKDGANTSNTLWVSLTVFGAIIIVGIAIWILRKKRSK